MYVVSVASFVHSVFLFLWCLFALFGGAVLSTCIWYPHLLRYSYTFTYTLLSCGIIHETCSYTHAHKTCPHIHVYTHARTHSKFCRIDGFGWARPLFSLQHTYPVSIFGRKVIHIYIYTHIAHSTLPVHVYTHARTHLKFATSLDEAGRGPLFVFPCLLGCATACAVLLSLRVVTVHCGLGASLGR